MAKDGPINLQGFASKAKFVTSDISFAPGRLGVVHEGQQLVKVVDAAVAAAGDLLYWKDRKAFTVTPTIANSSRNEPAGVAQVAAAANDFIFVAQRIKMDVKGSGTIADGNIVVSDTASNQVIAQAVDTSTTQTKFTPVGVAQGAVASGKVSVELTLESA